MKIQYLSYRVLVTDNRPTIIKTAASHRSLRNADKYSVFYGEQSRNFLQWKNAVSVLLFSSLMIGKNLQEN
jgi:hypothetical protein